MKVVYCATRNLYSLLPTTINSLLSNNSLIETIYLIIEDESIPYITHPKIKFINFNKFNLIDKDGINTRNEFTYMALARCVLSKILNEPKVLYLDVDTIIDGNLLDLWNIPLGLNLLAAYPEAFESFNSGVLLMNLRDIARQKYDDKLIELLHTEHLALPDQDAINRIFKGKIKAIPGKYNTIYSNPEIYNKHDFIIRHFVGVVKPWKQGANPKDVELWNKYKVDSI